MLPIAIPWLLKGNDEEDIAEHITAGTVTAQRWIFWKNEEELPTFLVCPVSVGSHDKVLQVAEEVRGKGRAVHGHKALPLVLPPVPEAAANTLVLSSLSNELQHRKANPTHRGSAYYPEGL